MEDFKTLDSDSDRTSNETWDFFGRPPIKERMSPVKCFVKDVGNIGANLTLIISVLATFATDRSIDELYLKSTTAFSLVWFTLGSLIQFIPVLSVLIFFLTTAAILTILTELHSLLFWQIIQGPQIQIHPPTLPKHYNPTHRWIYINGIATGRTITHQNLTCLSQTFHNPILAINNRTYGFLGDLLECIIQRAFGFRTKETGIAYEIIKSYLRTDSINKVILIAHSQGGIIASQILDDLFCSLSPSDLGKLEVYTFGSAALTFNNPWADAARTRRVVPVMEHYCNERDMVTSWGALASAINRDDLPFKGKVFVAEGQTGHMLNQHYLKYMFTSPQEGREGDGDGDEDGGFLNHVVREIGRDRYFVGRRRARVTSRNGDEDANGSGGVGNAGGGEKSVMMVSQLWKYMG